MHLSWRANPVSEQILHKEQDWKISPSPESQQEDRNTECSNWSLIHEEESLAPSSIFTPKFQIYITEGQAGGVSAGVNLDPPTAVFDNGSGSLWSTWWSLTSWVVPVLCAKSICVSICISTYAYIPKENMNLLCVIMAEDCLWFSFFLRFALLPARLPGSRPHGVRLLCRGNVLGTWKASGLPPGSIFPSMETGSKYP